MALLGPGGDRGVGGPSLWDILTQPEAVLLPPSSPSEEVRRDVLRNIRDVLNARRGRCMGHPDYGMPEVSEFFVSPRGMTRLAREIKRTIERWEPRVARPVDVRAVAAGEPEGADAGVFRAAFLVRARLTAPWNEMCTFRTMFMADGRAEVER